MLLNYYSVFKLLLYINNSVNANFTIHQNMMILGSNWGHGHANTSNAHDNWFCFGFIPGGCSYSCFGILMLRFIKAEIIRVQGHEWPKYICFSAVTAVWRQMKRSRRSFSGSRAGWDEHKLSSAYESLYVTITLYIIIL